MRKVIIVLLAALVLQSCLRLDSMMFNADSSITEYKLDDYDGEVDFVLPVSYDIPESKTHLFTLKSGEKNEKIHALYIGDTTRISSDTVIMYCHGNRDHMDFYWQRAKLLANCGGKNRYGVLMIDYKGYGLSEGNPSEDGLVQDVNTALGWLKSKGMASYRLVIYGFSLGTYPSVKLSGDTMAKVAPSKLITEAPFASTDVMAADGSLLNMPASFFSNGSFDNAEQIKNVDIPFLWIHGTEDHFLAIKTHGEVVYSNYNGMYQQAERVEGADHGDVPEVIGFERYNQILEHFITTN